MTTIKPPTGELQAWRVFIKGEPKNFHSKFTQSEAVEAIRSKADGGDSFARSLVDDFDHWKTITSMNKRAWLFYLAEQEYARQQRDNAPAGSDRQHGTYLSIPGARKLFDTAKASGLKLPEIWLQLDDMPVKLKMAPDAGKNPGCIYVTVGEDYIGKIDNQGVFRHAKSPPPGLVGLLDELHRDPVGTAKHYGKVTSRCCFCRIKLENRVSIYNGYGPICADHFGLPREEPPEGWMPIDEIKTNTQTGISAEEEASRDQ